MFHGKLLGQSMEWEAMIGNRLHDAAPNLFKIANFFVFNLNVHIFVRGFSRKQKVKPNTLFVFDFVAP